MAVIRFKNEFSNDYRLGAVATLQKAYQFCHALNRLLECDLIKTDDLELRTGNRNTVQKFGVYKAIVNEGHTCYFVYENKSDGERLLPEAASFDFLVQVVGRCEDQDFKNMMEQIGRFPQVVASVEFPVQKIKNKERLIYKEQQKDAPVPPRRYRSKLK